MRKRIEQTRYFQVEVMSQVFQIVTLAVVLSCVLAGCDSATKKEEAKPSSGDGPLAKVKVATVKRGLFTDQIEALGTVHATEAINLTANVSETITELHFEDGDQVKKGQLLAKLNDNEEQAMLEAARAQLAEQKREAERLTGLVKGGAVSETRLQGHETLMEVARRKIEEVEAQIADRRIEAPFDGVLGFRRVSLGALVSPGDVLATLDVLHPVKFDFTVPETFLSDLKPGLKVIAQSDAWPDGKFEGKVTNVDSRVNPVTRSVTVRSEIPNPDLKLRPGMLMTTTLSKNPSQSLFVPERAILSVQKNHFVFTVSTSDQTTVVVRSLVKIGRRKPGFVEILEGVEEGKRVVSDGLVGMRDGTRIQIIGEFEGTSKPYNPTKES